MTRRILAVTGSCATAIALIGCSSGEDNLSEARDFGRYRLYWLGDSFAGEKLVHTSPPYRLDGRMTSFNFIYGECEARSDTGCAPPLELQNASICDRNPLTYGSGSGRRFGLEAGPGYYGIRGALARGARGGGSEADIYTGRTTITIFTSGPPINGVIASLRPVDAESPEASLPPPAFPRSMLRELRRHPGARPSLERRIASLPRVRLTPC